MRAVVLCLCVLAVLLTSAVPLHAQEPVVDPQVAELIAGLSPQERVGQLLVVTFPGNTVDDGSVLATLIDEFRVGGFLLRPSNGNFTNDEDTPNQLRRLTNALQARNERMRENAESPYLPLLIGVDFVSSETRYADGLPESGFTQIPTQMALGATWSPELAEELGTIVGRELPTVGINMLLGLSLDVADISSYEQAHQLSTRTFGGSPYWVSQLGSAFIRGVHLGSEGRLSVVAGHFPGSGSSDRPPQNEIATVQKPLDLLQAEDLAPFRYVTALSPEGAWTEQTVDGLQTTNVRYRYLQGNIRPSTRPLALDAQSLPPLLAEPTYQAWRSSGGVMVSASLGLPALQEFYQEQLGEQEGAFPARTLARDALNAGNDLLLLADFDENDSWEDRLTDVQQLIDFFVAQYTNDTVFQARVDEALARIISLKLRLYDGDLEQAARPLPDPTIRVPSPLRSEGSLSTIGAIAQASATLLYPSPEELSGAIPSPPRREEEIVIITDARSVQDCSDCPPRPVIDPLAFEQQLVQRFGPQGSEELDPQRITSLSFAELSSLLNGERTVTSNGVNIAAALQEATWLLFLAQSEDSTVPESAALSRFLVEYTPIRSDQRIVAFAFGAPYDLDATEISRLSAYYALYSSQPRFIEAAGLLLFQAVPPLGFSPVSLPAINYTIESRLRPDPAQVVEICRDDANVALDTCPPFDNWIDLSGEAPELAVRTSVIEDLNGNPVPDGTAINFLVRNPNEGLQQAPLTAYTRDGVAHTRVNLARDGLHNIRVEPVNSPPFSSIDLNITVRGVSAAAVTAVPPTATPTATPTVTPTLTVTPTPRSTPVPRTPTPEPPSIGPFESRFGQGNAGFGWWSLWGAMMGVAAVGAVGIATATGSRVMLLRQLLNVGVYGTAAYLLYALLYGFGILPDNFSGWGAISLAVLGALVGLARPGDEGYESRVRSGPR